VTKQTSADGRPLDKHHTSAKPIVVHKAGEEGTIMIDRMSGMVMTKTDDRPDWADDLAVALLAERTTFYTSRLGPASGDKLSKLDYMAYQDLGWIGLDAEGDEVEIEADTEFRMEAVAQVLGVDREEGSIPNAIAEAELDADFSRTVAEATAIDEELRERAFESGAAVAQGTK
jgi:hypothetical protein